jgi:ParB family transcriptional regulator, chromosome partitioning protein
MQKRGLGKGLAALIPDSGVIVGNRTVINIDINKILPNPRQPRIEFHSESLNELAESIKSQGIVQPILIRARNGKYELVAGERRLRAAKKAGLSMVPAMVKEFSDEESLEIAIIENVQREDLNPMDEAEAYKMLATEFHLTQADISKKVGKERSTVANVMRLLDLPKDVQASLRKEQITMGHARPLLSLGSESEILALWKEIVKNNLSVRDVETLARGGASASKKGKKKLTKNEELIDLTELLTTHLGTKVRIHGSAKRGKIEIEYYSQEDLERIIESLTGNIT